MNLFSPSYKFSFASDDPHSVPPLLFHNMSSPHFRSLSHLQRSYPAASYPSDDYRLPDPRQPAYNSHMSARPALLPRQGSSHADTLPLAAMPDQQFIIPHPSASLFSSSSQQPLDMQQQQQQQQQHVATPAPGWSAYDHSLAGFQQPGTISLPYNSYTASSPFPPQRLTPPPPINNVSGGSQNGGPRMTLAGSLDPATGIFYRTPEHPRLRTAQACEKCRTRKAKCSGEHPSCKRCQNRGLVCEYAKEGRVRGPNKPKNKATVPAATTIDDQRNFSPRIQVPVNVNMDNYNSSCSGELGDLSQAMMNVLREQHDKSLGLGTPSGMMPRRNSLSMEEHRGNRPRPPNLNLDTSAGDHFRLNRFQPTAEANFISRNGHFLHDEHIGFTEGSPMMHTASQIPPISYQGVHVQASPSSVSMDDNLETKFPSSSSSYTYEENRSPSTSSSASMQGHHSSTANQSMLHVQNTYMQGIPQQQQLPIDENQLRVVDCNSSSSSPSAAIYGASGGSNGASTTHMDAGSVSLSLDPAWVDLNGRAGPTLDNGLYAINCVSGPCEAVADGSVTAQMQPLYPIDLQMR